MKHPNDVLKGVHIYSEIGRLRRVLLHRPGLELDNIATMYRLLFDELLTACGRRGTPCLRPYLKTPALRSLSGEPSKDILRDPGVRRAFLSIFERDASVKP